MTRVKAPQTRADHCSQLSFPEWRFGGCAGRCGLRAGAFSLALGLGFFGVHLQAEVVYRSFFSRNSCKNIFLYFNVGIK